MARISIIFNLVLALLPARLVALLSPKRDTYRGATIDAKAYAVGRLARKIRASAPEPTIEQSRAQLLKSVEMFDAKGPDIARIEDITLNGPAGPLAARLYSDQGQNTAKQPALVYYHGGGFIQGNLDSHHALCCKIAKDWDGIVVAVDYRLAPEHPYPAGVDDAIFAFREIHQQAGGLGIDPSRIGVGGDSAGGCFAAVVCQQMLASGGPVPAFQLLIYPVTDGQLDTASINDLEFAYLLPKERMQWYRDEYAGSFTNFKDPKFSPLWADKFAGLPRSYLVSGGFDPLMDDAENYADKLRGAGVDVTHRHFPGQIHAFVNLTKVVPEGRVAIAEICDWLRKTTG